MLDLKSKPFISFNDKKQIDSLAGVQRGIEKEGLRVNPDSTISQTAHPTALGSTLTHPSITTDYSEALLEFITPKQSGVDQTIAYLTDLHSYTLRQLDDQLVWPASMPGRLQGDASIPIARYGTSNVGCMKHVYRRGLGLRYGRIMQSIAGIHYNFSLPDEFWLEYQARFDEAGDLQDFKSELYFSLIRNFRRYSWLLHYLFGASPVLDRSFLDGREHSLEQFSENTFGLPYATSLRMSDLGYQNSAQEELHVSYNSLNEYVTTLGQAVGQAYPEYEKIGVKVDGEYVQLNANILQLENEYYSDIRPKRVTRSGEKPIAALRSRGVEYIEVRILDINPFLAEGIDAEQVRFLDAFLLNCLLSQCPNQSTTSCGDVRTNQRNIIMRGRDPTLNVIQENKSVPVAEAAEDLLGCILETARMFDQANNTNEYTAAVEAQRAKIKNPDLTPSGKIMTLVNEGNDFIDIAKELANRHKRHFVMTLDSNKSFDTELAGLARQSLQQQTELEADDTVSFDEYLAAYHRR